MSFLDIFKAQPKWKHTDPSIRAAAIPEIPDDHEHQGVVEELAEKDDDVRVRRAAIAFLGDVQLLTRLARSETDPELRREITERLVSIATSPAPNDAEAALALDGLNDPRQFSTIAKSSPHDTVRAAALGRVHDVRALSSIARHAADPQTALDAVARVPDPTELLNIALKTDHKEAGIAALEKCVEAAPVDLRETLENVASRAKNKSVSKRSRAMLQAIDDAAAARRLALAEWQRRVGAVLAKVEAVAASSSAPDADAQLAEAEASWGEVTAAELFELDPDTAGRFGALVDEARSAIAANQRQQAERRAADEHDAAIRVAQVSICERIENARAEDALDDVEKARAEWEGLPGPSTEEIQDTELKGRFAAACHRAADRHQNRQESESLSARLAELGAEAERLSAEDQYTDEGWNALQKEWSSLQPRVESLDPAVSERYGAADAVVRQRAEDRRAAAERTLKQQTQRVEQLIERATARTAAEDVSLREAERIGRELRAALDALAALAERDQQALAERVRAAQAVVAPKAHELREMDEWKRFANAAVQEELIARTEALRAKYGFESPEGVKPDDLDKVARDLHDIQERWKQAAEAPRAQAQALWHRYRQAA
ncbi:MAG: DUF349 domain-containing protein, partial [Acidobacteriota bacterium]